MARRRKKETDVFPGLFDAGSAKSPEPARPKAARPVEPAPPGPTRAPAARPFTVGELTAHIRARLEETGQVSVEGEISGCRRHSSGHVYFDLKDSGARLSCVVWRSRAARAFAAEPEEGMQVIATGRLDVYAPRGSYSLVVDRVEPVGIGARLAELEALKRELEALGWFERRRPLPALPRVVGVVTSRDGAALRDFLRTRSLRFPGYPVRLAHAAVQGPGSALEIADALRRLDATGVDVIVVCRGGGSLEDLWAFNERAVADAIHAASVPVVTGVGHETDTTLADLVADHRAHTPTDAAQAVLPDRAALVAELERITAHLGQGFERAFARRAERLAALARRSVLRRPARLLEERTRVLADRRARMTGSLGAALSARGARLAELERRLARQSPRQRLERWSSSLVELTHRLSRAAERALDASAQRFALLGGRLEGLSPLAVLARGYSVTTPVGEVEPLRDASAVSVGDVLETRLAKGFLRTRVEEVRSGDGDGAEEHA